MRCASANTPSSRATSAARASSAPLPSKPSAAVAAKGDMKHVNVKYDSGHWQFTLLTWKADVVAREADFFKEKAEGAGWTREQFAEAFKERCR